MNRIATLLVLIAPLVETQRPIDPTPRRGAGATISGSVLDSIAGRPLVGAVVQLVSSDTTQPYGETAISDSLGHYALGGVPNGRFRLGFFHPVTDSLGLGPPARDVSVSGGRDQIMDLAVPSARSLRTALCGRSSTSDAGGLVMGTVRDAKTLAPSAGVTVSGEWNELSIGRGGMTRRTPRRVLTTSENGMFAICDVPSPGVMRLVANRGADSTDFVDVDIPAEGFLRRELYLGGSRTVVTDSGARRDSAPRADSLALAPRRMHVGEGRLRGVVVGANTGDVIGRPLAAAQVGLVDGPQTRANERGEWTITDAPMGTRSLEVRAVGYYPVRLSVDVLDGAAPLRVELASFRSVLETMKVRANYNRFSMLAEFRERSRTGIGRYLTANDIMIGLPNLTSDVFRSIPGIYLENGTSAFDLAVLMRGLPEDRCSPNLYVNGMRMPLAGINDLNAFLRPDELVGIEIYRVGTAPAQFDPGAQPPPIAPADPPVSCGSIVIWTK